MIASCPGLLSASSAKTTAALGAYAMACSAASSSLGSGYAPREPTRTALYGLVAEQRATFAKVTCDKGGAPSFVHGAFERFLRCGCLRTALKRVMARAWRDLTAVAKRYGCSLRTAVGRVPHATDLRGV